MIKRRSSPSSSSPPLSSPSTSKSKSLRNLLPLSKKSPSKTEIYASHKGDVEIKISKNNLEQDQPQQQAQLEELFPGGFRNSVTSTRLLDGAIIDLLDIEELSVAAHDLDKQQQQQQQQQQQPRKTTHEVAGSTSHCLKSRYGMPASVKEVKQQLMPLIVGNDADEIDSNADASKEEEGLIYHARLVPDDTNLQAKMMKRKILSLNKDINDQGQILPRRGPYPVALVSDFMSSLLRIDNPQQPSRWIFSGVLNGWPGLTCLEVRSITCKMTDKQHAMLDDVASNLIRTPSFQTQLLRLWSAEKEGPQGIPPHIHTDVLHKASEIRVTLRAPPFTARGYTRESPGFVFWFEAQRSVPRLLHGTNILKTFREENEGRALCTRAHLLAHRYATGKRKELPKDKVTYHTIVLLEWTHGLYCTLVEVGLQNGLGGYAGKSNWYDDKLDPLPALYRAMPPEMIAPWNTKYGEIRCLDVAAKNLPEFQAYVQKYTGQELRFVDPRFTHSLPVRLSMRSKENIAQYLLNYSGRDRRYSELSRNCQTFAADFYGFLVGKKGMEPFHPLNRMDYTNRSHLFLYDYDLYNNK